MQMTIYDSVLKRKVPFEPIRENEASIYVCGPTVYDDAHLGHARSALSFDMLRRTLRELGYSVKFARNFTDIDDKIINKMRESGKSLEEITSYHIERYLSEMGELGIERADIEPKATESLDAIEKMVMGLIDRGYAYRLQSGDIYFDTSRDEKYGSISHMVTDEDENRSRIECVYGKRNPKDFALWKACGGDGDVCFDTSIGEGRPGWHIECSAMIEKHFVGNGRYTIDIHGGGADLLFPHHENEASQTRCATGHEIAKYWMHNGFVQIDGEKMSKSLGNSFFLKDALRVYGGETLRFYLVSVHYRNDFNFNEVDLQSSKKRLDRLYRLKKRVASSSAGEVGKDFRERLLSAMADDLNSSKAMAVIDDMVSEANELLDSGGAKKGDRKRIVADIQFVSRLMGFGGSDPFEWFQQGVDPVQRERIEKLLEERIKAKKSGDYDRADAIRDELSDMGIGLMDTPDGTRWEKL